MTRQAFSVLLLLALATPLIGCGRESPSIDTVRWEIEHRLPGARFERASHIRLGRLTLGLARRIVHMADPGDPDTAPLDDIRRLEVASYRVRSLPDLDHRLTTQTAFEEALARSGWTMAVRSRDQGSRTWVFLRSDDRGALSSLYVVDLDPSELTLVRIDGHLDHLFAEAVADHPKDLARKLGGGEGKGAR